MFSYLFVALGGALGAVARVGLSRAFPAMVWGIPLQILCINVLGCLVMGGVSEFIGSHTRLSEHMRYFMASGFLGAFTTFSAFTLEFAQLYKKQMYGTAFTYAALSCTLSIVFFFLGSKVARVAL